MIKFVIMDRGTGKTTKVIKNLHDDVKNMVHNKAYPIVLTANARLRRQYPFDYLEFVHVRPEKPVDVITFYNYIIEPVLGSRLRIPESLHEFECELTKPKYNLVTIETINIYVDEPFINETSLSAAMMVNAFNELQARSAGRINITYFTSEGGVRQ